MHRTPFGGDSTPEVEARSKRRDDRPRRSAAAGLVLRSACVDFGAPTPIRRRIGHQSADVLGVESQFLAARLLRTVKIVIEHGGWTAVAVGRIAIPRVRRYDSASEIRRLPIGSADRSTAGGFGMGFGGLKRRRRDRVRSQPFPAAWSAVLARNFPRYVRLPSADQEELRGHIQVFLAEKRFEGAAGLAITDEIRVTVAAQACFLLLHRDTEYYPGLDSIIVYPSEYAAKHKLRDESGLVEEGLQVRLGQTAARGALVLSWDAALQGAADINDCRNVVFHEFAHQLDAEEGAFNGAPVLPRRSMYITWARILGDEYAALRDRVARHEPTDLHPYGATNPAEFFAVATECFFQHPQQMQRRHAALYEELKLFYKQDPAGAMQQE